MSLKDQSYIGKGILNIEGRHFGNVSIWNLENEEETVDLLDFTSPGGGNYNSVRRPTAQRIAMVFHDYEPDNLALALRGVTSRQAGQSVNDESLTTGTELDLLIETAELIDTDQAVTVTSDPAGTDYTEGTDYILSASGIRVLSTGAIPVSTPLLITYESLAVDVIEGLTDVQREYRLVLDGQNEAQQGAPLKVIIHRCKFGLAEELPFISEEFAGPALAADILKDTSIADPASQYMKIIQKQAA